MLHCLNPKKAHENRGSFARPVPSGNTIALSAASSSEVGETGEEQVACQYCKYLLEGAVLGDCRIVRWIGSGAFGDVYEAEQLPPLSRRVAIKVMAIERVVDGESAEMFAREVSTIAALDHPNILPVLRVGMIDDGRPYLVMKYAAQGSLQQFCQPTTHTFSTPSMIPTLKHSASVDTPADALSIISAETLDIDETLKSAANVKASTNEERAQSSFNVSQEQAEVLETSGSADEVAFSTPEHMNVAPIASAAVDGKQQNSQVSTADVVEQKASVDAADAVAHDGQVQATDILAGTLAIANEAGAREDEQTPVSATSEILIEANQADEVCDAQADECISEVEETFKSAQERQEHTRASAAHPSPALVQPPEKQYDTTHMQEAEHISTVILASKARAEAARPAAVPSSGGRVLPLSLHQVLGYLEEAASALHYAHQRGLIHLDVKPANLLLDAEGRLMLADFGVSVLLEGYTHASLHYYVGTPLYTAPEQWLEQPRTASDQYALAVTCYQLLTGRPPFTGNLYAVMHGHLQASPPPMYEFNSLIPAQIETVLRQALAKDPAERYPDILAFARAFREASEEAASADTDAQMQQRAALLLKENTPVLQPQPELSPMALEVQDLADEKTTSKKMAPGTLRANQADLELPRLHTRRWPWLRNLLLCVLALLLVAGGGLGFVRMQRPCWLGICPHILLNTNAITLTNNELQLIEITNTGTDSLHWKAQLHPFAPWLSLSSTSGTLAPGHASKLTLETNVDAIKQNGVYTDTLDIDGDPGVATQTIEVTENVAKGLSAVSVNTSGQSFLYEQSKLQPGKQKITITNKSGHTLNWFTQYTDNNWLSVTPSQGSLKDRQAIDLTATVENLQNLANDTYQVRFSLVGQLDNQSNPTLLQTINFSLQVNQSSSAQVAPTQPAASPTAPPNSLAFTAQSLEASGAPGVQRANHSMVWNAQDDQLLIFGGNDAQGNVLNDLWSYNPSNNQWANLTAASSSPNDCSGGSPSPRKNAAMVWDNKDREVLLYGGIGSNDTYLGDLWAYSPAKNTWSVLACSGNGPGARGEAGAAWTGSQILLLGGRGASGSLADFWSYTPGSGNGWSQIAATTPLGARTYPSVAWDSHDKQLYVFGGLGGNDQQLGDFYSYQPNSGWSTIVPRGGAPMPRQQALSTWDNKDGVFLLMGGWQPSNNSTYSALWSYSPSDNAWWQITSLHNNGSTSVIPSRMASVMVWDSDDNRAYIYAGSSSPNKNALNDLWMITRA